MRIRGLALFLILFCLEAHAARTLIVGTEWEFANRRSRIDFFNHPKGGPVERGMRDSMLAKARELANQNPGDLVLEFRNGEHLMILPDGSNFVLSTDPGVVEIQSTPRTIARFRVIEPWIEKYVFGSAAAAKLDFKENSEAAHLHFDFESAFGLGGGNYDYLLFRNFLVDFYNHPELYLGILNDDETNAPGLTDERRQRLAEILRKFENELSPEQWHRIDARNLGRLIESIMVSVYPDPHNIALSLENAVEGMYLKSVKPGGTVEIRSVAMRSLDEWLKVAELFEARIGLLAEASGPLPLNLTEARLSLNEQLSSFKGYVTETRLPWDRFKSLANARYRKCRKLMQ